MSEHTSATIGPPYTLGTSVENGNDSDPRRPWKKKNNFYVLGGNPTSQETPDPDPSKIDPADLSYVRKKFSPNGNGADHDPCHFSASYIDWIFYEHFNPESRSGLSSIVRTILSKHGVGVHEWEVPKIAGLYGLSRRKLTRGLKPQVKIDPKTGQKKRSYMTWDLARRIYEARQNGNNKNGYKRTLQMAANSP